MVKVRSAVFRVTNVTKFVYLLTTSFRYTSTKINPEELMHTTNKTRPYSAFVNKNN